MTAKHHVALLIPYRTEGGTPLFYLQKRDAFAPIYPSQFGFFGGHVESGEDGDQAVIREIQEELMYVPPNIQFFRRMEHSTDIGELVVREIYIAEAEPDFENRVTVCEGEYGIFRSFAEVEHDPLVSEGHRTVLRELQTMLAARTA